MVRPRLLECAAVMLMLWLASINGFAQAQSSPTFEVASVKPSNPDDASKVLTIRGRQFVAINTTLRELITYAYVLHAEQVTGGPTWLTTEKFDVTGQIPEGVAPELGQVRMMCQQLLADRFRLTFHHSQKQLNVYGIIIGAKRSLLVKSDGDPNGRLNVSFRTLSSWVVKNTTMADFASLLQYAVLDRPVVDESGLTGRYDLTLNWTPDETQFQSLGFTIPPAAPDSPLPGLFTAIQEQLGLKLEPRRAPVDILVIDHGEEPSKN